MAYNFEINVDGEPIEETFEMTCGRNFYNNLFISVIELIIITSTYEKIVIYQNEKVTFFNKGLLMIQFFISIETIWVSGVFLYEI